MISYYQFFSDGLEEGIVEVSDDFGPVFISINDGPSTALRLEYILNHVGTVHQYHWKDHIHGSVKVTLQGNPPNGARLYSFRFRSGMRQFGAGGFM